MDFDAFNRAGIDKVRLRRLVIGYVIGAVAVSFVKVPVSVAER